MRSRFQNSLFILLSIFILFHRPRFRQRQTYTTDDFHTVLNNPNFNRIKTTTIYSVGFAQTSSSPSVNDVVDAYLQNGKFNFMLVNVNFFQWNVIVRFQFRKLQSSSID